MHLANGQFERGQLLERLRLLLPLPKTEMSVEEGLSLPPRLRLAKDLSMMLELSLRLTAQH